MGELIKHGLECPLSGCNSSDGAAYWLDEDGVHRGKCFSCGGKINPNTVMTAFGAGEGTKEDTISTEDFSQIENLPTGHLRSRKIHEKVASEYGVRIEYNPENGEEVKYYFPVYREGKAVAHKVRDLTKPKKDKYHFTWKGSPSGADFFGSEVGPRYGKAIIVTAGFEDAIAADQMIWKVKGKRYKCRSVLNGVQSAVEEFKKRLEYLSQFETVFICFDQDDHEQTYAKKCADLLPIGSAKIMRFSEHDANDMLKKGKHEEFVQSLNQAEQVQPDHIVIGGEVAIDSLLEPLQEGVYLDFAPLLMKKMHGLRENEMTIIMAEPGVGKTTVSREVDYSLLNSGASTGKIFLEESLKKTHQGLIARDNEVLLPEFRADPTILSREQVETSYNKLINNGKSIFVQHRGALWDNESLINKLRWMALGADCKYIVLDHIHMVLSERDSNNERKDIDRLLYRLSALVEEVNVHLIVIAHVKRKQHHVPKDKEGNIEYPYWTNLSLDDARGSGAFEQTAWNIIGIEAERYENCRGRIRLRLMKNREWGDVGLCDVLKMNATTGVLEKAEEEF